MRSRIYGLKLTDKHRQLDTTAYDINEHLWRLNWSDLGYPYCGVYVVTTDALWPCKIGVSTNPVKRLNALQTAHWRPLQITGYRYCETFKEARAIEKATHERLKGEHKDLMGEWFDVRADAALEAMEWVALEMSVDLHRKIPDELLPAVRDCVEKGYLGKMLKSKWRGTSYG